MSLVALRSAIVASIESEISTFQTVQAHGGRFDLTELRRVAVQSPAALIAVMGGPLTREGSQAVGNVQIICFVLTGGDSVTLRDAAALALVESVSSLVAQNKWAYADAKAPTDMVLTNHFLGALDREGIALWSVKWSQRADLAIYDSSALDDFHHANVKWDLAQKDGIVEMEDDIWLNGEFMSAYGHIYVSTSAATSISVADTYQKAAGTTTLKEETDFSMPANNRLNHDGTAIKPFLVNGSGSITVSGDAKVTIALAEDGIVDEDTEQEIECTAAEGAEPFHVHGVFNLDEDEYVELWVKADDTVNVTFTKMNLLAAST
jgi:hypothetical protein